MKHPLRASIVTVGILTCGVATPSAADIEMGVGGGVMSPWKGEDGFSVMGQFMGSTKSRHWRFGGEFEYRDYSSEFFGVNDVDVQGYQIRALFHYLFLPDAFITPYIGLGIGFSVNVIDKDKIEREKPFADVFHKTGVSGGGVALLGLELPLGDHFAFFGEGRAGVDVQLTSTDGDIDTENLGGVGGIGGIRLRF
jgi:hypothetical protein